MDREIARLKGREEEFDLLEYYNRLSVHLGSAAFNLLSRANDPNHRAIAFTSQNISALPGAANYIAWLKPGHHVLIGRRNGIEVFDAKGMVDESQMQKIRPLQGLLKKDRQLSAREHAEIKVISLTKVVIGDFGTRNGTLVTAPQEPIPGFRPGRPRLRLVVDNTKPLQNYTK